MRIGKKILLIALVIISVSSVGAEYRIYDNMNDFEADKWAVCEKATDGCNTYFLEDGKIWAGTEMYCEDHTVEWTCTQYKDDVVTTRSIIPVTTSNDMVACTMEYVPVCWVDGITYWNRCSAEEWAKVEIEYEGECVVEETTFVWLSENDESFYEVIRWNMDESFLLVVDRFIKNYSNKLVEVNIDDAQMLNSWLIEKVETIISDLLLEYPQDIELPDNVNEKYLKLTLIKFELMKIDISSVN